MCRGGQPAQCPPLSSLQVADLRTDRRQMRTRGLDPYRSPTQVSVLRRSGDQSRSSTHRGAVAGAEGSRLPHVTKWPRVAEPGPEPRLAGFSRQQRSCKNYVASKAPPGHQAPDTEGRRRPEAQTLVCWWPGTADPDKALPLMLWVVLYPRGPSPGEGWREGTHQLRNPENTAPVGGPADRLVTGTWSEQAPRVRVPSGAF